jgi:hypothetical protein
MSEIRGGGGGAGYRPTGLGSGQVGTRPSLNEAEQAKIAQQQKPQGKVSAQDAARLAQQAGFQRAQKKAGKGFDIGDSSRAPIPIPDDELDLELWTPERLESAQQNLTMAGTQFGEIAKDGDPTPMGETLAASSHMPTEAGVAKLQLLADRPAPQPMALEEVTTSVRNLFNIELGEDVPPGQKMLATGLVVAGQAEAVQVEQGKINEQKLAGGLQKVAERSNQAVGEAQKMSKGVSRELNLQRTFVFKR